MSPPSLTRARRSGGWPARAVLAALALAASYGFAGPRRVATAPDPTRRPPTGSTVVRHTHGWPNATPGFAACALEPEVVELRPTQNAPGGRASMTLSQPASPFGISVDEEGHQLYEVSVQVSRLRRDEGLHYVVWVATPELDEHLRLGRLDASGRIAGPVRWNKFMVFITEETDADIARWSGPVLLRGVSPSARMHTMAGHGPFEGLNCLQVY